MYRERIYRTGELSGTGMENIKNFCGSAVEMLREYAGKEIYDFFMKNCAGECTVGFDIFPDVMYCIDWKYFSIQQQQDSKNEYSH